MSTLPWDQLVAAVRTAGNRAGALHVDVVAAALRATKPLSTEAAALVFARLAAGPSADTVTAREIELELRALPSQAAELAHVVAPSLASSSDDAGVVQRAIAGVAGASSAIVGAVVPWSVVVDATLFEACRVSGASWGARALVEHAERAEELARRIAAGLGVPIARPTKSRAAAIEDPAKSARRLAELDPDRALAAARAEAIEARIRATLPRV